MELQQQIAELQKKVDYLVKIVEEKQQVYWNMSVFKQLESDAARRHYIDTCCNLDEKNSDGNNALDCMMIAGFIASLEYCIKHKGLKPANTLNSIVKCQKNCRIYRETLNFLLELLTDADKPRIKHVFGALVEYGITKHPMDKSDKTPDSIKLSMFNDFMTKYPDFDLNQSDGFHQICKKGCEEHIQWFLAKGADVNRLYDGLTPIQHVMNNTCTRSDYKHKHSIVELLIKHGGVLPDRNWVNRTIFNYEYRFTDLYPKQPSLFSRVKAWFKKDKNLEEDMEITYDFTGTVEIDTPFDSSNSSVKRRL